MCVNNNKTKKRATRDIRDIEKAISVSVAHTKYSH